ncbi:hypothetical protein A3I18_00320 [Candidatus Campbellbacteria bacterium RIFCSPLOWO2_02_FULL_35_11]|uniref:Transcriptional repressor PaaX-like central Cas2-like domain-containing protein n=2 Tax=Candidatus Campbelliibacteriota TaxID=1752727 RepID=A0A1F5EQV7_9BACT|nr:MAG: hypothetical protein A3E89_02035 [Candidatus Campbellbacteria bacterium RIFCSPHIGHO2_12_FULL_35_10]OGD70710.1 MAG: hypothetical protein A3I18_00320 [Candidatus Campbellbacteria bacterium RIFCSPLOWO2_02_FULL_35_11]
MVKVNKNLKGIRLGKNQKKIAILLLGGVALSLSNSPKKSFEILGEICEEWKNFDERFLKRSIKSLYESKVIKEKINDDGTVTLVLSDDGKKRAITYNIDNIKIKKPKRWDGKWRFILFDVPENKKIIRNALRFHLKNIGFYEFQKSVFVYPYDCKNEIDYVVEFYEAREFTRFIISDFVDNELHLKDFFDLVEDKDI